MQAQEHLALVTGRDALDNGLNILAGFENRVVQSDDGSNDRVLGGVEFCCQGEREREE